MFSNVMIGVIFSIALGAWVYSKVQRQTGGNTQNSLIMAGVAGFIGFLVVVTLLSTLF
jgi:hypothetical protein